jgi:hypothetical protein
VSRPRSVAWVLLLVLHALPALGAAPSLVEKASCDGLPTTVVFAVRSPGYDAHWYANFGYWSEDASKVMYGPGGTRLVAVDLKTKEARTILEDAQGSIRDVEVHPSGDRILFSFRKGDSRHYHLHEVRPDGSELRQLTDGPYDDLESIYLPGGDIVFCSSRCRRWVSCWYTQVATLHRLDPKTGEIRIISSNIEHDNTPSVLPDGRILYTRWEYVDRNQVTFHHLWTISPDGTGQMAYFGNLHPGIVMIDAKPIAGTREVAVIFSPGHGVTEHLGALTVVDPEAGPDARGRARRVRGAPNFIRDPWPLDRSRFLAARGHELLLIDEGEGRHEVPFAIGPDDVGRGFQLHEPRPLAPRSVGPSIAPRSHDGPPKGFLVLEDASLGRNMAGVGRSEVKKLLVLETLPKPANFSGGPDLLSWLGTFNLERILGTVPVEADGSAYFELDANRPVFFVALDERDLSVKRMQSFVSVMPGETTTCVGCHESRAQAPPRGGKTVLAALKRPPSPIEPFEGLPDVVDFVRDIQPILDTSCVPCHGHERREGKALLTGDLGRVYSLSYWTLISRAQVSDGGNGYGNRPPRTLGSAASPFLSKLDGSHHGVQVGERERRLCWLWIETGATYAGTYAAIGSPPIDLTSGIGAVHGVVQRRCLSCHEVGTRGEKGKVPLFATPDHGPDWQRVVHADDPAARFSIHGFLNLSRPERSLLLLGPLAREAGGYGSCIPLGEAAPSAPVAAETEGAAVPAVPATPAIFADRTDPDYRLLLEALERVAKGVDRKTRFEFPEFRPNANYVRELKRFGVMPASFDPEAGPFDPHAWDQAYWKSLRDPPPGS